MSKNELYQIRMPYPRTIAGIDVQFDGEGFFMEPAQWTEQIFEVLAREAGIEKISEDQRKVVYFIRKFYLEQGRPPLNHHLKIGTGISLMELEALFPGGINSGVRRLAGMRGPKGCKG